MQYIPAKTIITRNKSTEWFGVEYNMNIYKGCSHGCIYCDSRSECYYVENFDEVRAKQDVTKILRQQLQGRIKKGVIATGSMSDPYNPLEKKLCLTRQGLEIIDKYHFGVAIATKSDLITRDIDILTRIGKHSPALCKITITNADDEISKKIEPYVTTSSRRFSAIEKLANAGIYTGVLCMPILPYINDNEDNLLKIIRLAKQNGARFVYCALGVTLRGGQREYYYNKLDELFPNLTQKYTMEYGNKYYCTSPKASELYKVLAYECEKLGLFYKMEDIIQDYKKNYQVTQLTLF